VFLCVANKNCLLKGVAGGKRLRTTALDSLIKIYLVKTFSTYQDQPKGIGYEFLRVETSMPRLG
jgi:hypothetical protein